MTCWMQITAGRGPIECAWVVPRVLKCLLEDVSQSKLSAEVIETQAAPMSGTLSSALIEIEGRDLTKFSSRWTGTILWIGKSPYRPHQKRKNWFLGIETLAPPKQLQWTPAEVTIETMCCSGPGGQHVNKAETAVRVSHRPTGLHAIAREARSQSANRKLALARLAAQIAELGKASTSQTQRKLWSQHDELERGNPIQIYEGPQFELRK